MDIRIYSMLIDFRSSMQFVGQFRFSELELKRDLLVQYIIRCKEHVM